MSRAPLKRTLGAVAVLALAYTGASWYAGTLAQRSIEAWVAQANQDLQSEWAGPGAAPAVQVLGYARGVFSAQVRYAFHFQDEHGKGQTLTFADALQHGPWPWAAVRAGIWRPLAAYSQMQPQPGGLWQPWFDALEGKTPWQADSQVGFDGHVVSLWRFAPVRTADGQLDFSGGSLAVDYVSRTRQARVSGTAASLSIQDAATGGRLALQGLALDSRTTRSGDTDLQSRQRLSLKQARVQTPAAGEVVFDDPVLGIDAARTGSLLDSRVQYDLGQVRVGAQALGTLQLKASAQQVDVAALQPLLLAWQQIQARRGTADDEPLSAADEQLLRERVLPVLASAPVVSLDAFTWTNAQGKTRFDARAQFRPVADAVPETLGAVIERGIAQLSVGASLSKPMLLQLVRQSQGGGNPDMAVALFSMIFDQYTARLARAGLVQRQGDDVNASLRYADGSLTVNGAVMSPADFLARAGAGLGME